MSVEVGADGLALNENQRAPIANDGIVDLLALLDPDIGRELWYDFKRVEDVVAKGLKHGHHQGGLAPRVV